MARRAADLRSLADESWDLVVVGGGIVGSGILLDAVSRGLHAALVEQEDIAWGTSSRSSRLIHGGLRYLGQLRFELVREALSERAHVLRLAPHLVRMAPFLFPVYGLPLVHRAFYEAGLTIYDLLGAAREGGRHRALSADEALIRTPALRREALRGAFIYHDAIVDDARYTLAVVRTAQLGGALAITRVRAIEALHRVDPARLSGLRVRDELTGEMLDVHAARIVDATGAWAARGELFGSRSVHIVPSRGSHLLVARDRIASRQGVTIRVPGKVIFLIPWPGHWLIGTTDVAFDGPVERPTASSAEVDEILRMVNSALDVDLVRADIVGTYAGLRPLAAPARAGSTLEVSREHRVRVEGDGLVRVGGGKFTTYRIMARDAVDAALGRDEAHRRPSATAELALVGAADRAALDGVAGELAARYGLDRKVAERMVERYGVEAVAVGALGFDRDLLRPLDRGIDVLDAEVAWAAREELALSIDDVLARRTRLAQERPDRGAPFVHRVGQILGAELGWDIRHTDEDVERYLSSARREYGVPPAATPVAVAPPATSEPRRA